MSSFGSTMIPIPRDWQDFERKCRVLFECILGDPQTQTHGRGGQAQNGVDIYGRRGGKGQLVGIQCKVKDGRFGAEITEKELRKEVEKTKKFVPLLDEFILVTTAQDDAKIQEAARLLQEELKKAGRELIVAVWGWNMLEQLICQHWPAFKAFHPDATPYTDQGLEASQVIIKNQKDQKDQNEQIKLLVENISARLAVLPEISDVARPQIDELLDAEIDQYRGLAQTGRSRTALDLLLALKIRVWDSSSDRIKFRIISNIGTAYHRLSILDKAATAYLEAADLQKDNPIATANKIAAFIMRGELELAAQEAQKGVTRFPNSVEIAVHRLRGLKLNDSVEEIWNSFPEDVRNNADAIAARVSARRDKNEGAWVLEAENAVERFPESKWLKVIVAEAILSQLLEYDPSLLGLKGATAVDSERLSKAAEIFKAAWDESISAAEYPPDAIAAHNCVIALYALRRESELVTICDQVLERGVATDQTKKLRANIHVKHHEIEVAVALVGSMNPDPTREIWMAQALSGKEPERARALIESVKSELQTEDLQIAAASVVVDSFIAQQNWPSATAEAGRLSQLLPADPMGPLLKYTILHAKGDESAPSALIEAYKRLTAGTDLTACLVIARALEDADFHDEAAQALEGRFDEGRDSPALRAFVVAALNANRRATVAAGLKKLPAVVLNEPFFLRIKIGLALQSGDMSGTEEALQDYLKVRPRSLEMHLRMFQMLVRRDDLAKVKEQLLRPTTDFDGTPHEWLQLALIMDTFGDWKKAHELAYAIWLENQNDPEVNLQYVGIFLRPDHSREMPAALPTIEPNAAFRLKSAAGDQRFIIEPNAKLRKLPHTIAPDHPVAVLATGKKIGDKVNIANNEYEVSWIKPKQLDALHQVMETFNIFFPSTEGLHKVAIKGEGPDRYEPIFDAVKARQASITNLFDAYERNQIPIALLAKALGSEPVETFIGLAEAGRRIRICEGAEPERNAAFRAIQENNSKGCVVDDITLHVIRRLELDDIVVRACGPIAIVDHTLARLQQKRYDIAARVNEPDLSISWHDGQAFKHEVSVDQKTRALAVVDEDIAWIGAKTKVLGAQGILDMPQQVREVVRRFGAAFADEYLAAQAHDLLLLSEDMLHRNIGRDLFQLRTCWLQPISMTALRNGMIDQARYNKAILAMIDFGVASISVDDKVLVSTLEGVTDLPLPKEFTTACRPLGGPTAEIGSHLKVVMAALSAIWRSRSYPDIVRKAATSEALGAIFKNQAENIALIVSVLRHTSHEIGYGLEEYIEGWMKGHFIAARP